MNWISSASRSRIVNRSFRFSAIVLPDAPPSIGVFQNDHAVHAVLLLEHHLDLLGPGRRDIFADVIGPDRQLAGSAVPEHRELDRPGTPAGHHAVHRPPDRPA